ncbi:hypothetical protein L798_13779 [Zootermopsis nevadensis]|uniref:Uncharacterized protein n=1 Tax=Zootermopsis nevadensis TaxID=136037 RepID=A0A067R0R8_ZOONE|nr:hypothetical protein L798_13779 [Zootermopsis nevadensis]
MQAGQSLLFSGQPNEDNPHQGRVGILLSKGARNSLIDWKPVSSRLMTARFKGRVRNVTIVKCYAPTEEANEDLKTRLLAAPRHHNELQQGYPDGYGKSKRQGQIREPGIGAGHGEAWGGCH